MLRWAWVISWLTVPTAPHSRPAQQFQDGSSRRESIRQERAERQDESLRDLFSGKSRYNEFRDSGENIPSNILAARLRHLTDAGLVTAGPYQERPRRLAYRLTETGRSLAPVVIGMAQWGAKYIPGTRRIESRRT